MALDAAGSRVVDDAALRRSLRRGAGAARGARVARGWRHLEIELGRQAAVLGAPAPMPAVDLLLDAVAPLAHRRQVDGGVPAVDEEIDHLRQDLAGEGIDEAVEVARLELEAVLRRLHEIRAEAIETHREGARGRRQVQ